MSTGVKTDGIEPVFAEMVAITVDVEWTHEEVLRDAVEMLNRYGIKATFFCTHPGIELGHHEYALHPNFRRDGDTMLRIKKENGNSLDGCSDSTILRRVIEITQSYYPQAKGVRAHSLFYDSTLLPVYQDNFIQYDSTYCLPLAPNLRPVMKEYNVIEFPIYYMDHLDLVEGHTGFEVRKLHLEKPGLKVFDFHPNLLFINSPHNAHYLESKVHYHNPQELLKLRWKGKGIRVLFEEFLEHIRSKNIPTATLGDLNELWRERGRL